MRRDHLRPCGRYKLNPMRFLADESVDQPMIAALREAGALRAIQENSDRLSGHLVVVGVGQVRIRPLQLLE